MPGAVPRTATESLVNATLPYIELMAEKGIQAALAFDDALTLGINVEGGKIVQSAVAKTLGFEFQ